VSSTAARDPRPSPLSIWVVGAFHNVSAVLLWGDDEYVDEDVIVVGDSADAKQVAMGLAEAVTGRPGIDGGKLRLARQLEPFTAVLISINRRYKVNSGIRITGIPDAIGGTVGAHSS
jgi:predicted dinucleotide-binding enzyme